MDLCVYETQQPSLPRNTPLLNIVQIANSLAFTNFVLERSQPYRVCDFFDEVSVCRSL